MNEFERRALTLAQTTGFLSSVARKGQKIVRIEPFAYSVTITGANGAVIAAGAQAQGRIQFQSDSDFVIVSLGGDTIKTAGGAATIQITDNGSGYTFFNQPTMMTLVCGTNGFPFIFPVPKVVEPSTNVTVDLTNVGTDTITRADFSFIGERIFYAN